MANQVKIIRIEGMEADAADMIASQDPGEPDRMILTQGNDNIFLDHEGAAILADFLLEWATGTPTPGDR